MRVTEVKLRPLIMASCVSSGLHDLYVNFTEIFYGSSRTCNHSDHRTICVQEFRNMLDRGLLLVWWHRLYLCTSALNSGQWKGRSGGWKVNLLPPDPSYMLMSRLCTDTLSGSR
jgi:hypothetical protein